MILQFAIGKLSVIKTQKILRSFLLKFELHSKSSCYFGLLSVVVVFKICLASHLKRFFETAVNFPKKGHQRHLFFVNLIPYWINKKKKGKILWVIYGEETLQSSQ